MAHARGERSRAAELMAAGCERCLAPSEERERKYFRGEPYPVRLWFASGHSATGRVSLAFSSSVDVAERTGRRMLGAVGVVMDELSRLDLPMAAIPIDNWVIYASPPDCSYPFVVVRWVVSNGQMSAEATPFTAASLEDARAFIPAGLYNVGRQPEDDPAIVEVWL
jgi:hypothetical protein